MLLLFPAVAIERLGVMKTRLEGHVAAPHIAWLPIVLTIIKELGGIISLLPTNSPAMPKLQALLQRLEGHVATVQGGTPINWFPIVETVIQDVKTIIAMLTASAPTAEQPAK